MRGRKPKPTRLKLLEGNPGRRPLNDLEPQPEAALLEPPAELPKIARDEWRRIAKKLYEIGMLSDLEQALLEAYCYSFAKWKNALREMVGSKAVVVTKKGNIIQNPWESIANKAYDQMIRALVELGLSYPSRSRIKVSPKKQKDVFADFMRRKTREIAALKKP